MLLKIGSGVTRYSISARSRPPPSEYRPERMLDSCCSISSRLTILPETVLKRPSKRSAITRMPSPPAPCAGLITKSLCPAMISSNFSISFSVEMMPYISGT
ncbi:hypothetical protein D3C75_992860 [compost metagenome]